MWATCINELSPFAYELRQEVPNFLKKPGSKAGELPSNNEETILPIRPVALLGKCRTDRYPDCPNMPDHHIENAKWGERYLRNAGGYYWFDFDIVGMGGQVIQCRMVYNEGDGDCNDGMWGAVWERNTEELIVNILSTGDSEATIQAVSEKHVKMYDTEPIQFPSSFEERDDDPIPCMTMEYANDAVLEKFVGLAIRFCCVYSDEWTYKTYGYALS